MESVKQRDRMDPTSVAPPPFVFPDTTTRFVAGQNGRVNLADRPSAGGFLNNPAKGGFGYRTAVDENPGQDLMRGNWLETSLSRAFFSPENTKIIQNGIRRDVYDRSGEKRWVIDEQSADELQIVMRSIYLQYAKNLEYLPQVQRVFLSVPLCKSIWLPSETSYERQPFVSQQQHQVLLPHLTQ
jgi:hypothetical protein